MASPFMTGPFVPVAMLNLIRVVLGIHNQRFNLFVKCSRRGCLTVRDALIAFMAATAQAQALHVAHLGKLLAREARLAAKISSVVILLGVLDASPLSGLGR